MRFHVVVAVEVRRHPDHVHVLALLHLEVVDYQTHLQTVIARRFLRTHGRQKLALPLGNGYHSFFKIGDIVGLGPVEFVKGVLSQETLHEEGAIGDKKARVGLLNCALNGRGTNVRVHFRKVTMAFKHL